MLYHWYINDIDNYGARVWEISEGSSYFSSASYSIWLVESVVNLARFFWGVQGLWCIAAIIEERFAAFQQHHCTDLSDDWFPPKVLSSRYGIGWDDEEGKNRREWLQRWAPARHIYSTCIYTLYDPSMNKLGVHEHRHWSVMFRGLYLCFPPSKLNSCWSFFAKDLSEATAFNEVEWSRSEKYSLRFLAL